MPLSRIPGPTCSILQSGRVASPPVPVGGTPQPLKQVPVAVHECIFYPPPRLAQGYIYKDDKEAKLGCWATVAEMIVKWRNEKAAFTRPRFAHRVVDDDDDFMKRLAYMDFVNSTIASYGFEAVPGSRVLNWDTTELLASSLDRWGPLYCAGRFWRDGEHSRSVGGMAHVIAVFGAQWDVVYYRDPWDGDIKTFGIREFAAKLIRSANMNICRYRPHERR